MSKWLIGILIVLVLAAGLWWKIKDRPSPEALPPGNTNEMTTNEQVPSDSTIDYPIDHRSRLYAQSIAGVRSDNQFSLEIPDAWQAEWVPEVEAVNIYDPAATGATTLDQSQIFIRTFEADRFLTLQTVTIISQADTTVDDRPAVGYLIEKKADVSNFPNQPTWRNEQHLVTDVRVSDDSPSLFYVIARRPDLDKGTYGEILDSFVVRDQDLLGEGRAPIQSTLTQPTEGFLDRITVKPFGIYITPSTSPVQPERFSGYHTGADAEYSDVEDEVEVVAIADGTVKTAKTATGYGGVVVIEHAIDVVTYQTVYGHLDPNDLPATGAALKQGDRIGQLGEGGTDETDGERKHLHLALYKGSSVNLRGYVETEAELDQWQDPVGLIR